VLRIGESLALLCFLTLEKRLVDRYSIMIWSTR
jgi:hypothetical protein